MAKGASQGSKATFQLIDGRIEELGDWRPSGLFNSSLDVRAAVSRNKSKD
jgi:hypothetical protein